MGWLSKIFGNSADVVPSKEKHYYEKDNKGTRHETLSQASSYWIARNVSQKFDPYALYVFDNIENAKKALLELPCFKVAEDSNNIICTETLIFGNYKCDGEKIETIICGSDLSLELWEAARTSFLKHGGIIKNEKKPEKSQRANVTSKKGDLKKVKYVREDKQQTMGQTCTYRIHKAPDAESAKAFLEVNPVSKPLYYLVVETPEGNYCRDKDGIYKE
jgi:hypothetical protein